MAGRAIGIYNGDMFKTPFSKRGKSPPTKLTYEIPAEVRRRILHTLRPLVNRNGSLVEMFANAARIALQQYGHLKSHDQEIEKAAFEHFQNCTAEEMIDMLEWGFATDAYGPAQNHGVTAVNDIFREVGIGYEFSPWIATEIEIDPPAHYGRGAKSFRYEMQFPECTKKSNEHLHSTTVMPALQLLSGQAWKNANEEILQAHEHLRDGNYADAILWAGKCLESVLKIIIAKKHWKKDPKHTLKPLLDECRSRGMLDEAQVDAIQNSSGRIRNTYSGHGAGPEPTHKPPNFHTAEHMIQVTSANVLLLAKLAGMA